MCQLVLVLPHSTHNYLTLTTVDARYAGGRRRIEQKRRASSLSKQLWNPIIAVVNTYKNFQQHALFSFHKKLWFKQCAVSVAKDWV